MEERTSKFWAVVYSLIKGGVRYCNPESISELYETLAVPTLTYGLELCSLTQRQLDDLDKEGRKAIKQLFSISKHSRNYLHNLLGLIPISTRINNNKINLLTRLMQHDTTKSVVLSILNQLNGPPHTSFIHDVSQVISRAGFDFYQILICQNKMRLQVIHDDMQIDIRNRLQDCLKYWHIGAMRRDFKSVMEEYVPVRLDAN